VVLNDLNGLFPEIDTLGMPGACGVEEEYPVMSPPSLEAINENKI
jgi:hypothetical protein